MTVWLNTFVENLNKRDEREFKTLETTFNYYQKLLSDQQTLQIKVQNLENKILVNHSRVNFGVLSGSEANATGDRRIMILEEELQKTQEELRKVLRLKIEDETIHKRLKEQSAENEELLAQHRKDLNALSQVNQENEKKVDQLERENLRLEQDKAQLESMLSGLRTDLEVRKKDTLSVDETITQLRIENQSLLEQVIQLKTSQMDELNQMNDIVHKVQTKERKRTESTGGSFGNFFGFGRAPNDETNETEESSPAVQVDDNISNRLRASYRMSVSVTLPYTCHMNWPSDVENKMACSIAFDTWGTKLLVASSEKHMTVFDVNSKDELYKLRGARGSLISCSFSHDDAMVLGSGNDKNIRLWSTKTQRDIRTLTGHKNKVYSSLFTYGSKQIVSGSIDRTIRYWDTSSGICLNSFNCKSSCHYISLSCDGNTVISAHLDSKVRIWSLKEGIQLEEFGGHKQQCNGVDFSPDGTMFVSSSRDGTIHVVDIRNIEIIQTFRNNGYQNHMSWSRPCFSPDGQYIVAGSSLEDSNGKYPIFIWSVNDGRLVSTLCGHTAPVTFVDWHPKAGLASCDKEGKLFTWI